jgi:hypothetical protein
MGFLIEDLIVSIKSRTLAPISQNTFEESDLITIADEELLLELVSDIMTVREDFFLQSKTTSVTANLNRYQIPKRAIGNAIKTLTFIDTGSNEYMLQRIDSDEKGNYLSGGVPTRFYFEGDEVVLVPTPSVSGTLEFGYYAKPNRLIATSSATKITNVSSAGGTTTFTVNTDLSASLSAGSKIDVISASSPFLLWSENIAITAITSTTIQVATSDVSNVVSTVEPQVGDYICATGFSNIPMIPEEFHPILAQMSAVRILMSLGDVNKLQMAKGLLDESRKSALKLIKNRAESSSKKVNQRNGLLSVFR